MAQSDWHWFRYPFLDEGKDGRSEPRARAVLAKHGYRVAGVTMGFSDWAWTEPYARCLAKHDSAASRMLERLYLQAAREKADAVKGECPQAIRT